MRNAHCRTCNMTRKLKITENNIHTLGREIWRGKLKKLENLERFNVGRDNGKKTENLGKREKSS